MLLVNKLIQAINHYMQIIYMTLTTKCSVIKQKLFLFVYSKSPSYLSILLPSKMQLQSKENWYSRELITLRKYYFEVLPYVKSCCALALHCLVH